MRAAGREGGVGAEEAAGSEEMMEGGGKRVWKRVEPTAEFQGSVLKVRMMIERSEESKRRGRTVGLRGEEKREEQFCWLQDERSDIPCNKDESEWKDLVSQSTK